MTGDGWIYCHPFSLSGTIGYHSTEFMPQDQRFVQSGIADPVISKPAQVRAADSNRPDM
jgi:hypothetical protein